MSDHSNGVEVADTTVTPAYRTPRVLPAQGEVDVPGLLGVRLDAVNADAPVGLPG